MHPDGFKFVASGVVAALMLFLLWAPAGWVAAIATLWIAYFFRDPWRVTPNRPGLLISPADGIVVSVAPNARDELLTLAREHAVPSLLLGRVAGDRLVLGDLIDCLLAELTRASETGIETALGDWTG